MTTLILQHQQDRYPVSQKLFTVFKVLQLWMARHHQRKQLAQLDTHQLNDIGLEWADVKAEIQKPFWK